MTNTAYQNEQIKREFFEYLKGAKGFEESSINAFAEAIDQWQIYSGNDDFRNFKKTKASEFRNWLKTRKANTKTGTLSLVTQYAYLRRIKKFFIWLSEHKDYKKKVDKHEADFLRLSRGEARIAQQGTTKQIPTFEEAKKIIESIEPKTEIDKRDRALMSFALITGARIAAIVSLRIKNFDKSKKIIHQNPGDGVKTKNSNDILTTFFPIGWDKPEQYFMEWYDYLEKKGYGPDDPIFPATENRITAEKLEYSKEYVSKEFWTGTSGARKIFEKRCLNADLSYFHPHSFRHLIVNIISETPLTEKEKKAISLNLGHANIGTTFGSYSYGSMTKEEAVKIVQKIEDARSDGKFTLSFSAEERDVIEKILMRKKFM